MIYELFYYKLKYNLKIFKILFIIKYVKLK